MAYVNFVNIFRSRKNGWHFADGITKRIFLKEICSILIIIWLEFVRNGSIYNIPMRVYTLLGDSRLEDWRRFLSALPGSAGLQEWPVDHEWSLSRPSIMWLRPRPTSPEYSPVFTRVSFHTVVLQTMHCMHFGRSCSSCSHTVQCGWLEIPWCSYDITLIAYAAKYFKYWSHSSENAFGLTPLL